MADGTDLRTRAATLADAAAIAAIYNQGIADRIATFETEPRSSGQICQWFTARQLVIVAETAETGPVAFAASFPYSARACYAGIGEFSVYVERDYRGRGAGAVLAALIEAATAAGLHKLTSRVFPENIASRALLRSLGFEEIGIHRRHGQLDGVWRDCVIVERLLGPASPRISDETLGRGCRAWNSADARLGIELLPAGDPGRPDRARARHLAHDSIRPVLGRAAAVGRAGPGGRPRDR